MIVRIEYEERQDLKVENISVIGSFNEFDHEEGKMKKENGVWYYEKDLKKGEYLYRFLINDSIKLNDSTANIYLINENEELWSAILIGDRDKRLFNNTQYRVNIENYQLDNKLNTKIFEESKKIYNIVTDKKAVAKFEFTEITGIHAVTLIWYNPWGNVVNISEGNIYKEIEDESDSATLCFWIDLSAQEDLLLGRWKIKLFINGEFILEDIFNVVNKGTYYINNTINK